MKRLYQINWAKDKTGDTTKVAVKKLDDEVTNIYEVIGRLMHFRDGHKHTGKNGEGPRIFEIWRYD